MTTIFLIGRVIFGLYFIMNGYNHLANLKDTTAYAKMKAVPMPGFLSAFTGVMLLAGGFSVLLGFYPVVGMILLVVFLIPTTLMMHAFWKVQDPMQKMGERINFMKNWALIGALGMLIASFLPWQ